MTIAIVGGDPLKDYNIIDKRLNFLMESKGIYLFNVLAAAGEQSLGQLWAHNNGAPIVWVQPKDAYTAARAICEKADFVFFFVRRNQQIKNLLMRYMQTGKHGEVLG